MVAAGFSAISSLFPLHRRGIYHSTGMQASIVETPAPKTASMVDLKSRHQNLQARNKPIAGSSPSTKLLPSVGLF
jgi:hypothetical protein